MKKNAHPAQSSSRRKIGLWLAVCLLAVLITLPLICAEHGGVPQAAPGHPVVVDRSTHGSIRHVDTHIVQHPVEVHHEPTHPVEVHHEVVVHRDVEADVHRHHSWNDFAYGRHLAVLPVGFITLRVGGAPYYYCDGIYYQAANGGYLEVYPPVGAALSQAPGGAYAFVASGLTYVYAGGGFYLQQPGGAYVLVPPPLGVVVPEPPPGAIRVLVNGTVAYEFNGILYEPIFVNGVTCYETVRP